ncbi:MAG: hypothetical protein ACOCSF_06355 [Halanaeroarchaeum sp.]
MNHLERLDEDRWRLPRHAHIVLYEARDGNELLTIYDSGAAQKPPTAQLIGNLVRVGADHELVYQPNGYISKLREPAVLEAQADRHWVVRPRDD